MTDDERKLLIEVAEALRALLLRGVHRPENFGVSFDPVLGRVKATTTARASQQEGV